jgi:hypothetical protein
MRRLTQPWKLCRNLGVQPVGSVAGPRWPKAAIAAPIIPAQSSRRTCRQAQSSTFADLPNLGLDDNWGAGSRTLFRPQITAFLNLQQQRRRFRLEPRFQNPTSLPKPDELSKRLIRSHRTVPFFTCKAPLTNSSEKPNIAPGWIRLLGIFNK